jgi:3,4-dihydroxy 2-butanone 4-phosphate synthase/GTP cyclohydrolase II
MEHTKLNVILNDVKNGRPVIIIDDSNREDEADIVIAAEAVTKYNLIFAMRHAKGLMCIPCTQVKLDQFNIKMMNSNNLDTLGTPFATSIDATKDTSTGMSVYDRLKTIQTFVNDECKPSDLAQPGHLFPLCGKPNLLKDRRGHTESSLELVKLAGFKPISVIIEIMNDDGTMTKGEQIFEFAKIYNLNIITVDEIFNAVYNQSL